MPALFLKSLSRHLKWFVGSFSSPVAAPLGLKRVLLLLFGFPLFVSFQLLHWLGFLLDELLFRDYRKVQIEAPVFITGIPRSGTTFVHRTLAIDDEQFTTVTTWEAVLAPSITARKLLRALAAIDRVIGGLGSKLIAKLTQSATSDFNDIHEVDLEIPEEDYLWLLPAGSCFIMLLAFPFAPWLRQTGMLDTASDEDRAQLLDYYEGCIKKHLYASGKGRRFLSKNAAFGSWSGELMARFPDAKLILCVREPSSALSSQLSSLNAARQLFATDPSGSHTAEAFTEIFAHNYHYLRDFTEQQSTETVAVIDQGDLKAAPGPLIQATLQQLQIPSSKALAQQLQQLSGRHTSAHQYNSDALKNDKIDVCLRPAYEMILQSDVRVRTNEH